MSGDLTYYEIRKAMAGPDPSDSETERLLGYDEDIQVKLWGIRQFGFVGENGDEHEPWDEDVELKRGRGNEAGADSEKKLGTGWKPPVPWCVTFTDLGIHTGGKPCGGLE